MLITNKLQGRVGGTWVMGMPTRTTAKGDEYRCPACAQNGGDQGGQHLIVFKDRPSFACVAYPGDRNHRSIIWNKVGDKTKGRPDPIIPAKVEQKNTFIGRHVLKLQANAEDVLRADAALRLERQRMAEESKRIAYAEIHKKTEPQHIDTISNKVQVGTFGTVILSSSNMPPTPNNKITTVYNGGGYAPPTCEKASQTSQVKLCYRKRDTGSIAPHEFDSADLEAVFDTRASDWRQQYKMLWQQKYSMA